MPANRRRWLEPEAIAIGLNWVAAVWFVITNLPGVVPMGFYSLDNIVLAIMPILNLIYLYKCRAPGSTKNKQAEI